MQSHIAINAATTPTNPTAPPALSVSPALLPVALLAAAEPVELPLALPLPVPLACVFPAPDAEEVAVLVTVDPLLSVVVTTTAVPDPDDAAPVACAAPDDVVVK